MAGNENIFFIVGNSRSGTTMMLRILDNHREVYCLNELHFFEHLWSSSDKDKTLGNEAAATLCSKLLYIQRKGYIGKTDTGIFLEEARALVSNSLSTPILPHQVYEAMMRYETGLAGKAIPCEKTPQNVFYLREIFDLFPQAKVIHMVRDPRAILLSQKRKWLRRKMGAAFITRWETIRLRINYHPITLSRLWNAAIGAAQQFATDPRVLTVHFEHLLDNPEATAQAICRHLGITYAPGILDIPQASSSNEQDSAEKGIKKERAGNWKSGGLSAAEIWWCERISGKHMQQQGYQLEHTSANPLAIAWWAILFPVKLALALAVNLNRMKNVAETIRKRLAT
jgi:omega-hydroxy-beta-dihydromenaquinone-9 sulfotransferase